MSSSEDFLTSAHFMKPASVRPRFHFPPVVHARVKGQLHNLLLIYVFKFLLKLV